MTTTHEDLHFTLHARWTPNGSAYAAFSTKEQAIADAQELRRIFPHAMIEVCINRHGQDCAISTAEWWPFPEPETSVTGDDAAYVVSHGCDRCGATTSLGDPIFGGLCDSCAIEVPHCASCNENPADDDSELCAECRRADEEAQAWADNADVQREWERDARIAGDYCDCGQHWDEHDAELCEMRRDQAEASMVRAAEHRVERTHARTFRAGLAFFALALALVGSASTHAADYMPTAPVGCAITHSWAEDDQSAIAVCAGGYLITKDAGPIDDWDDIPYAIDTLVLTDANGRRHDWPVRD